MGAGLQLGVSVVESLSLCLPAIPVQGRDLLRLALPVLPASCQGATHTQNIHGIR